MKQISLLEIYNNLSEESNLSYPNVLYHGSQYSDINFDKKQDDTNYNMLGYGLYLTSNEEEAKFYATESYEKKFGYLYKININNINLCNWESKIPNNIKENILKDKNFFDGFTNNFNFEDYSFETENVHIDWDEMEDGYEVMDWKNDKVLGSGLTEDEAKELIKNFLAENNVSVKPLYFEIENVNEFYTFDDAEATITPNTIFDAPYYLVQYLYSKLKSVKAVSKYLVNCGLDGIISDKDTSDYATKEDVVCVIFNPNKINIVSKEYMKIENGEYYDID